ncbi:PHD and RING finger domain containing protein 1 [Dissostichus eleginoides]|nr:PHD and RING finger domain containing protein 1 [Dissostichus eleginoides]
MDEDDSQEELINRSTSNSKGKRPALWAISDEEEEGDAKAEDGALVGTSADLADMSSDEDADKCPICLNSFSSQPVATPENCEHYFCLDCILAWAKNANSCPVDRIAFNSIYLRKCYGGKVKKMITVQKPVKEGVEEVVDLDLEQTSCEACGGSDREDRLLLCDGCDSGYHMECLTPPLDSVPVEEWFCPECEATNRRSRVSAEQLSDTESLPSTARPATSRFQFGAAGPTRAIARTQQSERVRANVNRHRITQARSSQLAPTFLIQSTWLDDTINAVVAGLNTAVYIRDFTPRPPTTHRRKTRKRRKVRRKTTSSAKSKTGKAATTGVKRRKRRVRRTKSRRRIVKKPATPRSRIANTLRIVKDKKGSSLPSVYRPAENTLSNMRADIGAASLSIHGDHYDLDPLSEREEVEQQARVTSLLEAKRRGISRSALRSHQPVARPVTAGHSRRGMDVPQSAGFVEAAPVPDLLGSILSGQSVLLMDSCDVVINRDGSLKATKSLMQSELNPGHSNDNSSGEASTQISPMMSPNQGDSSPSLPYNVDQPGSSHSSMNRPLSQSSSHLPPHTPLQTGHIRPSSHSDLPPRGQPSLQLPLPIRPTHGHQRSNGAPSPSLSTKSKGMASSQSQKAPAKPMWPARNGHEQSCWGQGTAAKCRPAEGPGRGQSRYSSSASSSSSVSFRINTSGNTWQSRQVGSSSLPVAGNSTQPTRAQKEDDAKKRQLHRDKQKLLASRTAVKQEESSDTIYDPFDPTLSDSSSSDNEAESARLHGSSQNATREEKASSLVNKKQRQQDLVTVKTESQDIEVSQEEPMRADAQESTSQEVRFSEKYVKGETKSRLIEMKSEKTTSLLATKVKIEPGLDDAGGAERIGSSVKSEKTEDTSPPVQHRLDLFKIKREEESAQSAVTPNTAPRDPSASSFTPPKKEQKPETKSDSKSSHKSRDLGQKKKTFQASKERRSKSPETDRGKRADHQASGPGGRQKEKEKEKSSRRSRSRERTGHSVSESSQSPVRKRPKRQRSCSQSKERRRSRSGSGSSSRERSRKKKPLQRSKERSDGRDRDSDRGRESKDKRHGRGRSNSRSKSRSRSISRERKKDHTRLPQPSLSSKDKEDSRSKDKMRRRSRSSSREKRREEGSSSKSAQKTSGSRVSSSKDTKRSQDKKKAKDTPVSSLKEPPVIKQKTPSHTSASEITKKDHKVESQDTTAEKATEIKVEKEIKKEKRPSLDMFEDLFSISEPINKEESDIHAFMVAKSMEEKGKKEDPIKTEKSDSLQDTVSDPELMASREQPDSVKQEVQEPSDSDDDFNVDVMLDSLDYVKTERSEESGASVEKEGEEGEEEEEEGEEEKSEQISTVAKSKTQGKRVTWNIQEGPQPEKKSASKLSLYKLKLKQEGARRPSSTGQTSSQDITAAVSKSSKRGAVGTSSRSDGEQGEPEEGDLMGKDQYLKKLHMQERAIEEVKLAIKPFYQNRDIDKDEYKEILRKAVQKVCHSKSGEINPVKVGNLVKAYVDKYKHARKHKKDEDLGQEADDMKISDSP